MFLDNVKNRKLVAFIVSVIVAVGFGIGVMISAPAQITGTLQVILLFLGGALATFTAGNVIEDVSKAKTVKNGEE